MRNVVLAAFMALTIGCSMNTDFDEALWLEKTKAYDIQLLYAPHYDKDSETFFNPWIERDQNAFAFLRYRLFGDKPAFPAFDTDNFSHVENDYGYLKDSGETISFVGHASFIIKLGGSTIFTDPFLSSRAGIASKDVDIPFDFSKVPERPVILISHNHYDHLDVQSIEALSEKNAVAVCGLGLKNYMLELGAKEAYELDWWESVTIDGVTYTFLPAQHWSMRFGQWSGSTLWGSFLISYERGNGKKTTVYFSGDTGYFRGFEEYGRLYDIDYALLGVGAYEPRWFMHFAHMNVEEFLRAARELRAKTAIPMHFGVIKLGMEPIHYGPYELSEKMKDESLDGVKILRVGEKLTIATP